MLYESTGAYTPDFAAEIDKPDEIIADELGVSLEQARKILDLIERETLQRYALLFGKIVGWLLQGSNLQVRIYAMAFAAGLDQLNGLKSQAEEAEKLGCTRALMSHYVSSAQDAFQINVFKFRKSESARHKYRDIQLQTPAARINTHNKNKQK